MRDMRLATRSIVLRAAWAACLVAAALSAHAVAQSPETAAPAEGAAAPAERPRIVSLKTEWYPLPASAEGVQQLRMVRELVRQGVLAAAREELGLVTRDETLQEPIAAAGDDAASQPLELIAYVYFSGEFDVRLFGAGATKEAPIWKYDKKVDYNKRTLNAELATVMTDVRAEIAEALRAAGFAGEARELNPENAPPPEVLAKLGEINFVSQYGAVRAAHLAMRKDGPSLAWLDVLARGYAHLALLTEHLWSSQHEAFAARALLYAERMAALDGGSVGSRRLRAYVRAVIGAQGSALDEVAEIAAASDDAEPAAETPGWFELVEPYAKFDHAGLAAAGAKHPELAEITALLQWSLYRSYMHGRWIYEKSGETVAVCPEAYGVFSVMAGWNALRVKRMGASGAMATFAARIPPRVGELADLPASVKSLTGSQNNLLSRLLGGGGGGETDVRRPMEIARALRAATRDEATPSDFSWAILAELIAEEQFVEVANYVRAAGDGVEYSKEQLIDQIYPLVEGHRYATYIDSYRVARGDVEELKTMLQGFAVRDPRANMMVMLGQMWSHVLANGQTGREVGWSTLWQRNFTLPGMLEAYYGVGSRWSTFSDESWTKIRDDFAAIAPHAPNTLRLEWESVTNPTVEQLAGWEKRLGDDPVGWLSLGVRYFNLHNDMEAAARCYKRSIEISPSYDGVVGLATAYRNLGKEELWQPTLESYLKEVDLSLSHAEIHQLLATDLIAKRDWAAAEPHALAAAETWSAWGLNLAGIVYEGLGQWEKSEYFFAESARGYPSTSAGTDWYFWCRRTGRGDLAAARAMAERSVAIARANRNYDNAYRVFVYNLLMDKPQAAVTEIEQVIGINVRPEETWDRLWRLFHAVAICEQIDDPERKAAMLAGVRAISNSAVRGPNPEWGVLLEGVCRTFEGEKPDEAYFENFDKVNAKANFPANYNYFLGVALIQAGDVARGELYLRRAAFGGNFRAYNATLAGAELVKRYGPDRGGIPEEFAATATEASATADDGNEADADASAAEAEAEAEGAAR